LIRRRSDSVLLIAIFSTAFLASISSYMTFIPFPMLPMTDSQIISVIANAKDSPLNFLLKFYL
ncbi:MAG TPA: hypothetical protein VFZ05_00935, partial [Nitrososphaera sp.]